MANYTVDTTSDTVDAGDGVLSLREALALADATEDADTILFADAVQGRTIVLAGSQLTVSSEVTIDGGSGVTIDADGKSRVLLVQSATPDDPSELVLAHLSVIGGRTTGEDESGGGIRADGYAGLTLDQVTVSGNGTEGKYAVGGGIAASGGYNKLTLINSTVSDNHTMGDYAQGGGVYGYDVSLSDTTVSGNRTSGDQRQWRGITGHYVALTSSTVNAIARRGRLPEGAAYPAISYR